MGQRLQHWFGRQQPAPESAPWHYIQLAAPQLRKREHEGIASLFQSRYVNADCPHRMSLWLAAVEGGHADLFFSPDSTVFIWSLLDAYAARPCAVPGGPMVLVAGHRYTPFSELPDDTAGPLQAPISPYLPFPLSRGSAHQSQGQPLEQHAVRQSSPTHAGPVTYSTRSRARISPSSALFGGRR